MNNQDFKWDDNLVEEFSTQLALEALFNKNHSERMTIEQFKASKQKPLEYEILSFVDPNKKTNIANGNVIPYNGFSMLRNHPIFSVKRLSDNCIFSIGDEVVWNIQNKPTKKAFKIVSFQINNMLDHSRMFLNDGNIDIYYVEKAEPKKQPTFTLDEIKKHLDKLF